MKKIVKIITLLLVLTLLVTLISCEKKQKEINVNIGIIAGPTGIGAVNLWKESCGYTDGLKYHFTLASTPDEIVAGISKGELDIAAVSTNLAAKLYKKTEGGIKILCVNTLGVLNVLNYNGAEVTSMADLSGRTIYTTGQGANPEYIINYLLSKNDVTDANIEFVAEGSELVSVWAKDPEAVIIAPQPVATAILVNYEGSQNVLSLTEEWDKVSEGSALMMGCVIVRTEFLENNKALVDNFLVEYEKSVNVANTDVAGTAAYCEMYGIVSKYKIAKAAIPECNICYITGEEMKTKLTGYLQVLYDADNSSIGAMPDDNFWYLGQQENE